MKDVPIEIIYVALASMGGITRYLNGYINGEHFKFSIFLASGIVAGFSGFMFALLGDSLNLPTTMTNVMAGVGGFFGEQTLKFIMELVKKKVK